MTNDDVEFSISQYLDGSLEGAERQALEERLAGDVALRATLDEYRRLNAALKSAPLPEVRWDALASSISAAIDRAEDAAAQRYRLPAWARGAARLAMAACVLIAAGVGIRIVLSHSPASHVTPGAVAIDSTHRTSPGSHRAPTAHSSVPVVQMASVQVFGPQDDRPAGPVQIQVSVGPGRSANGDAAFSRYDDAIITRPSHVAVASGIAPSHDDEPLSFDMQ